MHERLLLKALKYNKADSFNFSRPADFRSLVLWLENTKIRQLKIEERKPLGQFSDPQWDRTFQQYLDGMQCPLMPGRESTRNILHWLLRHAVSLEYQDNGERRLVSLAPACKLMQQHLPAAEQLNKLAASAKASQPSALEKRKREEVIYPDLATQQTQQLLQQLLGKLQVEQAGSQLEQLQFAKDLVSDQLLPALQDSQLSKAARQTADHLAHLDTETFNLGFQTGDAKLDSAATILRMLYIKDLRALQSLIDRTIVEVQEFTANPRTDTALGRVGR